MFSNLLGKIFAHASTPTTQATAPASAPASAPAATTPAAGSTATPAAAPAAPPATNAPAAAPQAVDVTAILNGLAAKNSEELDWKKSIVDLLKLLDMDSSLGARKELAADLGYSGDASDSATLNLWLHKEVMKKLAENGGKVPAELLK